jgi:hypothetical protein
VQLPADTDISSVRRKLACDLYYIERVGFWLDLRIGLTTVCQAVGIPFTWSGKLLVIPAGEKAERAYETAVANAVAVAQLQPA